MYPVRITSGFPVVAKTSQATAFAFLNPDEMCIVRWLRKVASVKLYSFDGQIQLVLNRQSVLLPVRPSVCLSVRPSVCPSVRLSVLIRTPVWII
jgi:hypothetical protein